MMSLKKITTPEGITIYRNEPLYYWLEEIHKAIEKRKPAIIHDDYVFFLSEMMNFPHEKQGDSYIFKVCGTKLKVTYNPEPFPPEIIVEPLEWKWECKEV